MTERIYLNKDVSMDIPKLIQSRLGIFANPGGGKSWAIRRCVEQASGKVQQIVLDPEGEFSTLREKYDFILAGPGGETPADPRSAALLAKKLLELGVSAVIDIYELNMGDRKLFVKNFLFAMVDAPKALWHPCLTYLDEAHVFAPEKGYGQSEALEAVSAMASRGRKRGFCLIPATQRAASFSKDVSATLNNKLIGRTTQDVDVKRVAFELGLKQSEAFEKLRLAPGHFYAFGPAISETVREITIGPIQTSHGIQSGKTTLVPKPTPAIRKILGKLADLPKEAEKELRDAAELRKEIAQLKRDLAAKPVPKPAATLQIQKIAVPMIGKRSLEKLLKAEAHMRQALKAMRTMSGGFIERMAATEKMLDNFSADIAKMTKFQHVMASPKGEMEMVMQPLPEIKPMSLPASPEAMRRIWEKKGMGMSPATLSTEETKGPMSAGERKVLTAISQVGAEGASREQLTVMTGYKRSSRDTFIQRLKARGYIFFRNDGRMMETQEGIAALGADYAPLPTGSALREHWLQRLAGGEKNVLQHLVQAHPQGLTREEISAATGYQRSSRDTFIQRLGARRLIVLENGRVKASAQLYD